MTLKEAKAALLPHGITINKQETGEYRVAYVGNRHITEPSAYYTNDINDAVMTGAAMASQCYDELLTFLKK